MNKENRQHS